jgi:DNA-binding MurR/RpiR family transcriptional regulator
MKAGQPMIIEKFTHPEDFNGTEQAIIKYIEENMNNLDKLTIRSLAAYTYTSTTTVNRFCNHICDEGFREFKIQLIKEVNQSNPKKENVSFDVPFSYNDSLNSIGKSISNIITQAVKDTEVSLDYDIVLKVVLAIMKAKRLFIFGKGDSFIAAKEFKNRLLKINRYVMLADENHETAYNVRNMSSNDFALFITYSGNHKGYNSYITLLNEEKIPTAIITANNDTKLSKRCNYVISIPRDESYDEKIANFASSAAINYILNVIYSGIFKYNYQNNIKDKYEKEKYVTASMLDDKYY